MGTGSVTMNGDVVGNKVHVKVAKNKLASPFRECDFEIIFGKGISGEGELLEAGKKYGIIKLSGAWVKWVTKDELIAQGMAKAVKRLEDDVEMRKELEDEIKAAMEAGEDYDES